MNDNLKRLILQIHGVWLYRWHALIVTCFVAVFGWAGLSQIQSKYYSEALLQVDSDSVLRPLLKGLAVDTDIDQRVRQVTQALLSRPTLERLALEMGFINNETSAAKIESVISGLSKKIDIKAPNIKSKDSNNLYTIGYASQNPVESFKVTQLLVKYMVEGSIGANKDESEAAQSFLASKIKEYDEKLSITEKKLAEFKQKNIGLMPGQGGGYYNRLQTSNEKLEEMKEKLKLAIDRRTQLQAQEKLLAQTSTSNAIENQLSKLRDDLNKLLLSYTSEHPDVVALKEVISQLEKRKSTPMSSAEIDKALSTNQVYQNLLISINENNIQISTIESQVVEQEKRISELKKLVNTIPHIEAELSKLDRDYTVVKDEHATLVSRLQSAKLSDAAEQSSTNLKFKLIDPPVVPLSPVSPKRPLLATGILFAAFIVGVLVAYLLNMLKPVYSTAYELRLATGFPVLGVVSYVSTQAEQNAEVLDNKRIMYVSIGLIITYILVLILQAIFS